MIRSAMQLAALVALAVGFGPAAEADEKPLQVLATVKDLADIAERIGGERVEATAIARGTENVHFVPLRPSCLVAANRADVFLQVGLSLEHAWVPGLLERGRNKRILPGAPGFCNTSIGFEVINVPERIDRSQAVDIHPEGNPHINLDPRAGRHFAERIAATLIAVDPDHAAHYRKGKASYLAELAEFEAKWAAKMAPLAGTKVVVFHEEFDYLTRAAGIEIVAVMEPKPGLAPTASHLAKVVTIMRERDVDTILTAKWSNNRSVAKVAKATGATVVELPAMVGGRDDADTWISNIDATIDELVDALAPSEAKLAVAR